MTTPVRLTPPIGAYGVYTLKAPFVAAANTSYRCISIRRVEEIVKSGKDIFTTFYQPMGLSQAVADSDIGIGVLFIGLLGTDGSRIYVPDTYILKYPSQSAVTLDYKVVSVDLGPQPSDVDLTNMMAEMKNVASKYTGIDASLIEVSQHMAVSTSTMTQEEYVNADAARLAALENVVTSAATITQLNAKIAAQEALIQTLTKQITGT